MCERGREEGKESVCVREGGKVCVCVCVLLPLDSSLCLALTFDPPTHSKKINSSGKINGLIREGINI